MHLGGVAEAGQIGMVDRQFPIGQRIALPGHFAEAVVLEAVRALGAGCECRVRLGDGTLEEIVLSAEETSRLALHEGPTEAARLVDPGDLQLLVESARIRLAYTHDQQSAVSLPDIRTLPHQIEAVYQKMLPQPCLRFLLKEDLKDMDGQRLFPDCHAVTVPFTLNADEFALYKAVKRGVMANRYGDLALDTPQPAPI